MRVERADADAHLFAGGEAPAVAGGDVAAVDPDLEIGAGAIWVHLEAARERRVRRLIDAVARQHAAPPKSVDDQGRGQVTSVGQHGRAGATIDLGRVELEIALR